MTESKLAEIKDFLVENISSDLPTREVTEPVLIVGDDSKLCRVLDRASQDRVKTVLGSK
jgi:hypothetical protein